MQIEDVTVRHAHAEAFGMRAARLVVTGGDGDWARRAAATAAGLATSVIGCDAEAGLDGPVSPEETPDGRPGWSVLVFSRDRRRLEEALVRRIGQGVLTCATAACYDGFPAAGERVDAGRKVAMFGDGHERRATEGGRDVFRVPVTEGWFRVEAGFGVRPAVGGGAFLVLARSAEAARQAAGAAVRAMKDAPGVILPFPGGISRAASKVGAERHAGLPASTDERFCPGIRDDVETRLPDGVESVLEVVADGLDEEAVRRAMGRGLRAACRPGVVALDAASFDGRLGEVRISLRDALAAAADGAAGA